MIAGSVRKAGCGAERRLPMRLWSRRFFVCNRFELLILLRALGLAVRRWETDCRPGGAGASAGEGIAEAATESAAAHLAGGVLRRAARQDRGVDHIHVHHGYFGSWIGMVAARLLGVNFSMTLHGSDLLLNGAYLDTKLKHCRFCVTISEYNRRYILEHFPAIDPQQNHRLAAGCGRAGTRGIAEGCPRHAPHLSPCWRWDGCMR